MTENIQKYPEVNRVEVISSEGEEFIWDEWEQKAAELELPLDYYLAEFV